MAKYKYAMKLAVHCPTDLNQSIFSETRCVLKPKGLNYFSVRNHNDQFYGAVVEVEEGIYDVNGFEVRFFSEKETPDLTPKEGFKMLWMYEEHEEPVTLYLVYTSKQK